MMARCATCGALLGSDAEWCGQCYALVRSPRPKDPDTADPSGEYLEDPPLSPNGDSATSPPLPVSLPPPPRPALAEAAAIAALPPDIQITLASESRTSMPPMSDRARTWGTTLIVLGAVGSDALFFPHVAYMVVYGVFVSVPSALAIHRLWRRRPSRAATSLRTDPLGPPPAAY
jgi:hypothetical protein